MNDIQIETTPPFLKWIGSKRWLKKEIGFLIDRVTFNNYHEPFLGSGAVFFENTINSGYLNDLNEELIITYKVVQNSPNELLMVIKGLPQNEEAFYQIREIVPDSDLEKAARFIYLNKSSYNGLYRVNNDGKFNASYGKRKFDLSRLSSLIMNCSNRLQSCEITYGDYKDTLVNVRQGDIVFLDPPYSISENKGYTRYTTSKFQMEEQFVLREYIESIKKIGAKYILTNEYNDNVITCFNELNDRSIVATRKSVVSRTIEDRVKYNEVIYTNIQF